jgi:hypothetical protein
VTAYQTGLDRIADPRLEQEWLAGPDQANLEPAAQSG